MKELMEIEKRQKTEVTQDKSALENLLAERDESIRSMKARAYFVTLCASFLVFSVSFGVF